MSGLESSFKKIAALIESGKEPNEAIDMDDDEEKKKKKRFLKQNETERFIDSFKGIKR